MRRGRKEGYSAKGEVHGERWGTELKSWWARLWMRWTEERAQSSERREGGDHTPS